MAWSSKKIAEALGPRDLDTLTAFAEFLKTKRTSRSFGAHAAEAHAVNDDEETPSSQEPVGPIRSGTA